MIVYNVTVKVTNDIKLEYIEYMLNEHIPEVMNTGLFLKYEFLEILNDDDDGATFAIKYDCSSMNDFNDYQDRFAKDLQEKHAIKYKDQFMAFRTLMKKIAG